MTQFDAFERTYPRYPFAPLVALGLALARRLARCRNRPADGIGTPQGTAPAAG